MILIAVCPGGCVVPMQDGAGHVGQASPEMLLRQPTTCKTDMWSLGMTLVELLTVKFLWVEGDNEAEMLAKIAGLLGLERGFAFSAYRCVCVCFKPVRPVRLWAPYSMYATGMRDVNLMPSTGCPEMEGPPLF